METNHRLNEIIGQFLIHGTVLSAVLFGSGHINETYLVKVKEKERENSYILQEIHSGFIKDIPLLMENIQQVTEHIAEKVQELGGDPERETITVMKTKDSKAYVQDADGKYYRMYAFIDEATSYDRIQGDWHIYECGKIVGRFQKYMADFKFNPKYYSTVKDFHNTKVRYQMFLNALEKDSFDRAKYAKKEIKFLEKHKKDTEVLVDLLEAGRLPLRATHNDPKVGNIMIDDVTKKAIALVDLDTVMPGLSLYDYGDALRSAGKKFIEKNGKIIGAAVNDNYFALFTKGYLEEADEFLTDLEVKYLPFSVKLLSLELGMRYLTDFLEGDIYFKKNKGFKNLDKAKVEFSFVKHLEEDNKLKDFFI